MLHRRPYRSLLVSPVRSSHILNSIPTVIYSLAISPTGFRTEWISESVKRVFGHEVEEALAPDWWINCLHPDDRALAVKKTSILMAQGHLVQEYRLRSKDGQYLWIQDEASLLRGRDGRPKEIIGYWTNITERKQAEEQISQVSGREIDIGEDELARSNNRIAVRLVVAALIIGSGLLLLLQKQPLLWGATTVALAIFALSCGLGLILISLMLNLDYRSRRILNSIPTVIYVLAITARGFRSQWISDSVKRIMGYEVEEALAPDWWVNCLHPDDREAAVKKTAILMAEGHLVQEYRFRSKDGHYLWIQDEASFLRRTDGQPKEIVGYWTNITERKLAEVQAARARQQEFERSELIRTSDRNMAVATLIAVLIIISGFFLGTTALGFTVFVGFCILGFMLIWLVVNSGKY